MHGMPRAPRWLVYSLCTVCTLVFAEVMFFHLIVGEAKDGKSEHLPYAEKEHGQQFCRPAGAAPPHLIIHCFAFNRPAEFGRLWRSLTTAKPAQHLTVEVVIHIDHDKSKSAGWQQQLAVAKAAAQESNRHGGVRVHYSSAWKGLRATMFDAWTPSKGEYAMFLEDDIEVSPLLLVVAEEMIYAYGECRPAPRELLGFKLYNQKWDEVNQRPEEPLENGLAPFKLQEPCSWGTVFLAEPVTRFQEWYQLNSQLDPLVPNSWTNVWPVEKSAKKFLMRWMWEEAMYLICVNLPHGLSLTTPRLGSPGTNFQRADAELMTERLVQPLLNFTDAAAGRDREAVGQRAGLPGWLRMHWPAAAELWTLNLQHQRVQELLRPSASQVRAFTGQHLPAARLLDSLPMRRPGSSEKKRLPVRQVMVSRARQALEKALADTYGEMPPETPALSAAAQELLQSAGLPETFVSRLAAAPGLLLPFLRLTETLPHSRGRHSFIVEPMGSFARRLDVLASAMAVADTTGRLLVVHWDQDAHCQEDFAQAFVQPHGALFIYRARPIFENFWALPAVRKSVDHVDLVGAPGQSDAPVSAKPSRRSVHVRSDRRLHSNPSSEDLIISNLRLLTMVRSPAVADLIDEYYSSLKGKTPNSANLRPYEIHEKMVGVRVNKLNSPSTCSLERFVSRLLQFSSGTTFFLSSENSSAIGTMRAEPGLQGRLFFQPGLPDAMTVASAATDLLLLSQTRMLLVNVEDEFSNIAGALQGKTVRPACTR